MELAGIGVSIPNREVSVAETLDLVRFHSKDTYDGNLDLAIRTISRLLHISGAKKRYWMGKGEKAIDHLVVAAEQALRRASVSKEDIDLVIYTGVGRGFIEPGNSYLVAKSLGMVKAECFDILDACMSYARALNVSEAFLRSNQYETILIVNAEFNNIEGSILFPDNYKLTCIEDVERIFPTYTVGDVASATVIKGNKDEADWEWHFASRNDWSDLCTAPTPGYASYLSDGDERSGKNGIGNFCSYGNIMHERGAPEIVDIYQKLQNKSAHQIFPHASSKSAWEKCAVTCGVADKMFYVYPEYGNLVSASVPTGIYLAEKEGLISKGDSLTGWVGSAGMSFCSFNFTY